MIPVPTQQLQLTRLHFVFVRFVSNGRRTDQYIVDVECRVMSYVHSNLLSVNLFMNRKMTETRMRF